MTDIRQIFTATVHPIGEDADCSWVALGGSEDEIRRAILEDRAEEIREHNQWASENDLDDVREVPTWDGTTEDWLRFIRAENLDVVWCPMSIDVSTLLPAKVL